MRAATLFCVLATAQAWKMPLQASLLEKPGRPHCQMPENYVRDTELGNDTKWKGSQRRPTAIELKNKDYLAEPYLHTAYYINLDKSTDRAEHMIKQFQKTAPNIHVERFAARNKTDAKFMDKTQYTVSKEKQHPAGGTIATYLSHWHMLKKISEHNDSRAVFLVLEDDATLTENWAEEVMCQIKQLPADWDLYKFGYWPLPGARWAYDHSCSGNIRQKLYNQYTCNQRSFALEWMGNLGYAVRPAGAAKAIEHLHQVPVMDVDGAMMPGCCIANSSKVPQNVYVSRYSLIKHGSFHSVRLMDKQTSSTAVDLSAFSDESDARESSYQARVRITEAMKRGQFVDYSEKDDDLSVGESQEQEKVTALAGLGA